MTTTRQPHTERASLRRHLQSKVGIELSGSLQRIALFISAVALCAVSTSVAAQAQYSITDLGAGAATAINNAGQVVGNSSSGAFLYSDGGVQNLGAFGATDINNSGQIVGNSGSQSILYSNGILQPLGSFYAVAINDSGQIAGNLGSGDAAIYSNGSLQVVPRLGFGSQAYDINNIGQIVGYVINGNGVTTGFQFDGSTRQPLNLAIATAINDFGQVAGQNYYPSYLQYPVFVSNGTSQSIGSFPYGSDIRSTAINNSGQVVGFGRIGDSMGYTSNVIVSFLYGGGSYIDLLSALPLGSGWTSLSPLDINDAGQIVGSGTLDGQQHAFLLSPVPEPESYAMMLVGLGVVVSVVRRRRGITV